MAAKIILTAIIGIWLFWALKKILKDLKGGKCPGCGGECYSCRKKTEKK